jgi:hypothetical protein
MQIEVRDDIQSQAVSAGFASVEEYVATLLDRDAKRVAIHEGSRAMQAGRVRSFEEFDRDFRARNGLPMSGE